jgi:hypothetical protein
MALVPPPGEVADAGPLLSVAENRRAASPGTVRTPVTARTGLCIPGGRIRSGNVSVLSPVSSPLLQQVLPQPAGRQSRSRVSLREDSIWPFMRSRLFWLDGSSNSVGIGGMVTVIAAW